MEITNLMRIGWLLGTGLVVGCATVHAAGLSPNVLSVTERHYLDIYEFYHEVEIGLSPGEYGEPIYETRIIPVQYRIADFIIHGDWAPGEVDGWSFGWNDWTFAWNLSETEGRRPAAADHNPWYDFTYYGFDLHASHSSLAVVAGGLGGFPDRFGLVDEGTAFEDLSGIIYLWSRIPDLGEGPYFQDNLVQSVAFFDTLTPAGDDVLGEGLLSFSAGFEEDGLWTRLVVGERLGIIPEPGTVGLLGLGFLALLIRRRTPR